MNDTDRTSDVRTMEERRRAAMLAADTHALREILDEGLVYVHSTGTRDDRESFLARLERGAIRYDALSLDVIGIQMHERFALLHGKMDARIGTPDGTLAVSTRYEAVWMRSGEAWRVVAFQGLPPGIANAPDEGLGHAG
ncbi:hypothetical protein GQ56_0138115 [Burkholderia paludis]|uniref:nuclear transport factor 2 family protein n=1 Tax=Burkholderia paludis TaxID=1506587 RepID=UPI0004DB6347|nr:nuclear transport factor 2 family protein [Burkholderia paludis]KFG92320.1 hypothetical protein GQ56_0138115 [Burkholderia paludis]